MPYIKRDTLKELFELCDIYSPGALSGAAGLDVGTARLIFKRTEDEEFIRVNRGTLSKLCEALVAYPEELTGEDVMREMRVLKKMRQRLDEMDPGALVFIDLRFRTAPGGDELIHRYGREFLRRAGIKRYIAYICGDKSGVGIITDRDLDDAEDLGGLWFYGDAEVRPLIPSVARAFVRAVAADEKIRGTVWMSRIESGARIGEK